LDTSILIAYLVPDENEPLADNLVLEAIAGNGCLVSPAFAWAEVFGLAFVGPVARPPLRPIAAAASEMVMGVRRRMRVLCCNRLEMQVIP
jgi:predicted nucleic acid-binding protein